MRQQKEEEKQQFNRHQTASYQSSSPIPAASFVSESIASLPSSSSSQLSDLPKGAKHRSAPKGGFTITSVGVPSSHLHSQPRARTVLNPRRATAKGATRVGPSHKKKVEVLPFHCFILA